jgi:hypothetical protein
VKKEGRDGRRYTGIYRCEAVLNLWSFAAGSKRLELS